MILYSLRCDSDHAFEGWFRDAATFDRQRGRGQIPCPACGSTKIEKAPMAPRLGRSRADRPEPPAKPQPVMTAAPALSPAPEEFRRKLQELRRFVETKFEHVGPRFAEEARRIHRGEVEARGIYGEATKQESEALADEGIEVANIPWVPASDA